MSERDRKKMMRTLYNVFIFFLIMIFPLTIVGSILGQSGETLITYGYSVDAFLLPSPNEIITITDIGIFYWDYDEKTLLKWFLHPVNDLSTYTKDIFYGFNNNILVIISRDSYNMNYPIGFTRVLDINNQRILNEFNIGDCSTAVLSPDDEWLATGYTDNNARIWGIKSGKEKFVLSAHTGAISSLAFSPDTRWLMTGSEDNTASIWDMNTGQEIQVLTGHLNKITCGVFSPDNSLLYTGSDDKTVRLWDILTGKEVKKIDGFSAGISSIALSPDGSILFVGSDVATLYNTADFSIIRSIDRSQLNNVAVIGASFGWNGKRILLNRKYYSKLIWDFNKNDLSEFFDSDEFPWHTSPRVGKFSPGGKYFLTGGSGGRVYMWDSDEYKVSQIFIATPEQDPLGIYRGGQIRSMHWYSNGNRILIESSRDRYMGNLIWNVEDGKFIKMIESPNVFYWGGVFPIFQSTSTTIISSDGTKILAGSTVYDAETYMPTMNLNINNISSVDISPDGQFIATGGIGDNPVILWNAKTGRMVRSFDQKKENFNVSIVKFLSNQNYLLAISTRNWDPGAYNPESNLEPALMNLWEINSGNLLQTYTEIEFYYCKSVILTPDPKKILMLCDSQLWTIDIQTGLKVNDYSFTTCNYIDSFDIFWNKMKILWIDNVVRCHTFNESVSVYDWILH